MRILAISNHYPPDAVGGYEWAAHEVLTRLAGRGHTVHVLAGRPETPCPRDGSITRTLRRTRDIADTRTLGARMDALGTYLHNVRSIEGVVREFQPEVLYLWAGSRLSPAILAASEATNLPLVLHLEDEWVLNTRKQTGTDSLGGRISLALRRMISVLPQYELSRWHCNYVSHALKSQYEAAGFHPGHARVVHNGYDPTAPARAWPDTPPPRKRIGFVGRVHPVKGLEVLLNALAIRQENGADDFELVMYGGGEPDYVESVRKQIDAGPLKGRTTWHGPQPREKMLEAYRSLDLLVVPSVWEEPFGLVAIEALGAGVPVIASDRGGLAEIVDDTCGWRVEPEAESLANAIDTALADWQGLRTRGVAGRVRVEQAFAWSDKVDAVEEVLREAVGR